jgi:hypothetical protein
VRSDRVEMVVQTQATGAVTQRDVELAGSPTAGDYLDCLKQASNLESEVSSWNVFVTRMLTND